MGAWGVNPTENDGAYDLRFPVEKAVTRALAAVTKTPRGERHAGAKWARIGVVSWALGLGFTVPVPVLTRCLAWLNELAADKEWIASWRKPADIRRSLRFWQKAFAVDVEYTNDTAWAKRGFGRRQRGLLETVAKKQQRRPRRRGRK